MSQGTGTKGAREKVYTAIAASDKVRELATGGINPIDGNLPLEEALTRGPQIIYYNESYDHPGFRRYTHTISVDCLVPTGEYNLNGEVVGSFEYAEALHDAVVDSLESKQHGSGSAMDIFTARFSLDPSYNLWQILVRVNSILPPQSS